LGLGAIFWTIQTTLTGKWRQVQIPLGLSFALYLGACLISLAFAADFEASLPKMKKLLEPFVFFLLVNYFRDPQLLELTQKLMSWVSKVLKIKPASSSSSEGTLKVWEPLIYLWFLAAMVSGLFAYYQIFTEIDPTGEYRASGPLGSAMTFSGLILMVLVVMTSRLVLGPSRPVPLVLIFLLILGAFIISYMRSGWLAYIIALIFLLYMKKRLWAAVAPVIIIILLYLSPPFIKDRIFTVVPSEENPVGLLVDKSFKERQKIWMVGWEIFKENPVFGCGFDCTYNVRMRYIQDHPVLNQASALHSNFLQLMVDVGLVGLAAWLFIWVQFFKNVFRILKALDRQSSSFWVATGSLATVFSFLIVGVVESNFFDTEVALVLFFIMALPFALDPHPMKKTDLNASSNSGASFKTAP